LRAGEGEFFFLQRKRKLRVKKKKEKRGDFFLDRGEKMGGDLGVFWGYWRRSEKGLKGS
jgi:hypothetical protein